MNLDQYQSPALSFSNGVYEFTAGIASMNLQMPDSLGLFSHFLPAVVGYLPGTVAPVLISFRASSDADALVIGAKILGEQSQGALSLRVSPEIAAEVRAYQQEMHSFIKVNNRLYLPGEFPHSDDAAIVALML